MHAHNHVKRSPASLCGAALMAALLAGCAGGAVPKPDGQASAHQQADLESALHLARASRNAGDFASAISLYRSVLAMKSEDGLLVELGDTLVKASLYDDAIDIYERVGDKSPVYAASLLGLVRVDLALSKPSEALKHAERAFSAAPGDFRTAIARGVSLDMLGRHDEAQELYRGILKTFPRNAAAQNDLALSLIMSRKLAEAAAILEPMARSADAKPEVRQNLALVYGLMGDEQRAAQLSHADLDDAATASNLRFFDYARGATN